MGAMHRVGKWIAMCLVLFVGEFDNCKFNHAIMVRLVNSKVCTNLQPLKNHRIKNRITDGCYIGKIVKSHFSFPPVNQIGQSSGQFEILRSQFHPGFFWDEHASGDWRVAERRLIDGFTMPYDFRIGDNRQAT